MTKNELEKLAEEARIQEFGGSIAGCVFGGEGRAYEAGVIAGYLKAVEDVQAWCSEQNHSIDPDCDEYRGSDSKGETLCANNLLSELRKRAGV